MPNSRIAILIFILALVFPLPMALAQDLTCSECYQRNRPVCERGCDSNGTRFGFSRCADGCVHTACGAICGNSAPPEQPTGKRSGTGGSDLGTLDGKSGNDDSEFAGTEDDTDSGPCGSCLRSMSEACQTECIDRDPDMLAVCRPRCANRRCAAKCQLPGGVTKEAPLPRPADCARCKHAADTTCMQKCGENKDRAGYTACLVSCGEQKCDNICNPSSYE